MVKKTEVAELTNLIYLMIERPKRIFINDLENLYRIFAEKKVFMGLKIGKGSL